MMIPSVFSMITPAPLPLELDDPSTKTVHSSVFSSAGKVISARKYVNACAFRCNALFIYLIILVEFRVLYMTYMIYVDK